MVPIYIYIPIEYNILYSWAIYNIIIHLYAYIYIYIYTQYIFSNAYYVQRYICSHIQVVRSLHCSTYFLSLFFFLHVSTIVIIINFFFFYHHLTPFVSMRFSIYFLSYHYYNIIYTVLPVAPAHVHGCTRQLIVAIPYCDLL